ncbi:MAG: hypothetical protein IPG17_29305 [Sandaracinaceae bacterium]|nr:hypothetical protein [Sandaracinaceae bacterium]
MDFYSGCRIPDASRLTSATIRRNHAGLNVEFFDSQAIASLIAARGWARQLLDILSIESDSRTRRKVGRPELRQDAVFAAAFFGIDSRSFRESVLENAIVVTMGRKEGASDSAGGPGGRLLALTLGEGAEQEQLAAALDRLRQKGEILGRNGHVSPGPG